MAVRHDYSFGGDLKHMKIKLGDLIRSGDAKITSKSKNDSGDGCMEYAVVFRTGAIDLQFMRDCGFFNDPECNPDWFGKDDPSINFDIEVQISGLRGFGPIAH